jgi:hypothetical protein
MNWAWWCRAIIPALYRLRQEDHKFKTTLRYIEIMPQNTKGWTGEVVQVVKHLPSTHETLEFKPQYSKKFRWLKKTTAGI